MGNLIFEFASVKHAFFPAWDRRGQWRAVYGTDEQCRFNTGYCDSIAKKVFLCFRQYVALSEPGRRALLIHEICHDTGAPGHNRRWATRMESAACLADAREEHDVARLLRGDIYSYAGPGVTAPYVASEVTEAYSEFQSSSRYDSPEKVVARVARYFGVSVTKLQRDFAAILSGLMDGDRRIAMVSNSRPAAGFLKASDSAL